MKRRETIKILAAATFGASLPGCRPWTTEQPHVEHAAAVVGRTAVDGVGGDFAGYALRFFTEAEMKTVRLLADLILPADERSGSASDARVPEFIDFTAWDRKELQVPLRGGLAWMDYQCVKRFGSPFVACSDADRTALLDDIAWPETAKPEFSQGVEFFSLFRDMTASGFFSSRMGVHDLGYQGNTAVATWQGCPTEALDHLGTSYEA